MDKLFTYKNFWNCDTTWKTCRENPLQPYLQRGQSYVVRPSKIPNKTEKDK